MLLIAPTTTLHQTTLFTMTTSSFAKQMDKVHNADGFLAALDQSGGSTPKALKAYGLPDDKYVEGEESMFEAVHDMRTRIMTSPSFTGDRILGAILFEDTMDREVNGMPTAQYLWETKGIVPFLKVDKGKAPEENGVELMKPIPGLDALLGRAKEKGIFGTKMRSVVKLGDKEGIKAIVDQQFEFGKQICAAGLIPILEPEVDINSEEKHDAEKLLLAEILDHLDKLGDDQKVMLKLTLPSKDNFYKPLIEHKNVLRVVALSGGYTQEWANKCLAKNQGMTASFSRALLEGLTYEMSDDVFDRVLMHSINEIFKASKT